ncbi:MAG TPA: IPT/TIG domain-containing protein, partial [Candidatus Sulfotelmatobacter sp.]|nr:IPT/TIG domain-containing protein [Candidatus Sulfotelmatobacter sp.]
MTSRKLRSRLAQVVLTNLCLCALVLSQAKPVGPPTLSGFSPTQGAAGSTVTITFTGTNFVARGARLILTPNQGVTIGNALVASSGQISVMVQIDASAQPGNRQVLLMDADHSLISPTPFVITAGQQPCSPNALAAVGCGPALRGFTPLQGTQGSTVTLTFTGANFVAPASLQFTPSAGLTVQSATVTSPTQIQAQISIAPNAALGARGVVLTTGKTRLPASNTFTVVSSTKVELPPMQILRVVPNQIAAGSQNVDLTLQGTNFVPGIQVTFTVGAGVPAAVFAAGPARYINSTEIHVMVNALPSALPGGRDVNLQAPNLQTMVGKGMLNVQAVKPTGPPTVLKIVPITLQNFPQGVITLTAPTNPVQGSDGYGAGYVIPMLDDSAVFQWQEKNPGLADYYVLRIYAKDGKTLLASQKITGPMVTVPLLGTLDLVPTYFRPDSAFLKQVLSNPAVRPSNGASVTPQFDPAKLVGSADMQWEVAGFHTYNKNGVAPQQNAGGQNANAMHMQMIQGGAQGVQSAQNQGASSNTGSPPSGGTVDVQVEISNRWPLDATRAPTGLACNGGGMTGTGLQINDVDGTLPNGAKDPNSYIGDRFVLSGSFSVAGSPYASQQTFAKAQTTPPSLAPPITQVQFNNLFVDWGDGTVQAVSAPPSDANDPNKNYNWDPTQSVTLPQSTTDPNALIHKYQATGSFKIRVFQLSEADLQHVNIASVSASVDGPTTTFTQTALLSKMAAQGTLNGGKFTLASLQSGMQAVFSGGGSGPPLSPGAQVASDAYMLFCAPALITVPEDLAADGPLHLKGIDDPDFNSYDLPKIKQIGQPGLERGPLGQQGGKP